MSLFLRAFWHQDGEMKLKVDKTCTYTQTHAISINNSYFNYFVECYIQVVPWHWSGACCQQTPFKNSFSGILAICLWLMCTGTWYVIVYFPYRMKVMMRLFSPRKTTLMFVIRDKTKVWIYAPVFLLQLFHVYCASFLECTFFVPYWICIRFITVHVDPTWIFGACSKGRYSEGIFLHILLCSSYAFFFSLVNYLFVSEFSKLIIVADMGSSFQTWGS